jgi:hypothetical protein
MKHVNIGTSAVLMSRHHATPIRPATVLVTTSKRAITHNYRPGQNTIKVMYIIIRRATLREVMPVNINTFEFEFKFKFINNKLQIILKHTCKIVHIVDQNDDVARPNK